MTRSTDDSPTLAEGIIAELERAAADAAREAGHLLMDYFGRPLDVEYKGESLSDPVTEADRRSQALLVGRIKTTFPDHAIVGEEDESASVEPLSDIVWVLDPLDGTRNFSQGLPMFASSVGVLLKGVPIAGAIFIPWPEASGRVLHARTGGGAACDGKPLSALCTSEPESRRLAGLPGGFSHRFRFDESMRNRVGEARQTGSIAYELAMVASGTLQYSALTGSLSLWDVAAGSVIVSEAGGRVLVGEKDGTGRSWCPFTTFVSDWEDDPPSSADLHKWYRPMIFGAPGVADAVAAGIRPHGRWTRRLGRWFRRMPKPLPTEGIRSKRALRYDDS